MEDLSITYINELVAQRRSIYPNMYSDERVDDIVIEQMLENANWAPTHKLTEPWRFRVFCDAGLKKLADFQSRLYKQISEDKGTFSEATFEKLATNPLKASHVISIGMKRDVKASLPEVEEISSVACAVQNMYLTATAYGVGCYWGSGGVTYFEEAKSFFGLENADRLLGFLYVGMPKNTPPQGNRKPMEQKVTWERNV